LKKKTFIFFLPNFLQGGAAESTTKLIIYLSKKKHLCFLICLGRCFYRKILEKNNIRIYEINSKKSIFAMFKIKAIVKKIVSKNLNTLIISNINYANVLTIIFLRSLKNLKIIIYERTPIQELNYNFGNIYLKIKNKIIKLLILKTYKFADKIITNSNKTSLDLSRYIGIKVFTIYSKSIHKIIPFKKKQLENTKILWIGRFSKEKSFDTLINAINILKNQNIIVNVLSNSENMDEYLKRIRKLKIENNFKFFGYKNNLRKYFNSSNLYVSTSFYESFPNSVVQAINNSLPIISSRSHGGINDLIKNKISGVFFKTNNPKDLANKILDFINNKQTYIYYASNAHKNLKKIEFNKIEKKFEDLLLNS